MKLEQLKENLYSVTEVVDPLIIHRIVNELPNHFIQNADLWLPQPGQEQYKRAFNDEHELCLILNKEIYRNIDYINQITGTHLTATSGTRFWLDFRGFTTHIHRDGTLPYAMQLFWLGEKGTSFYHSQYSKDLFHEFPMIPGTGYLALNLDPENNDLWHGMLTPTIKTRLSSYTYFYDA